MKTDLSPRERAVLDLAVQGYTDEMISRQLGIEVGTVNTYWVRLRGKLGHLSRTELVARYVQKNADETLAAAREEADFAKQDEAARSDGEARAQMELLDAAHEEILRLKRRLNELGFDHG